MTRRRWIADEISDSRSHAALLGTNAAHLARVLRAQPGQEFEVAYDGKVSRAVITNVREDRVDFELHEEISAFPGIPVTLLLAIFKFDRMEWAIEKCTELNVARIVPVIARRTEKHLAHAAGKRVDRWRRIAREAAQQSRRTAAPDIQPPAKLIDGLQLEAELRILVAEQARELTLDEILRQQHGIRSLALAIGPEGGWTEEEVLLFERAQWQQATLGPTILRAETAAIAALAISQAITGSFGRESFTGY